MRVWLAKFGNDGTGPTLAYENLLGVFDSKGKAIHYALDEAYGGGCPYEEVKHANDIWAKYSGTDGFYVEVDSWEVL